MKYLKQIKITVKDGKVEKKEHGKIKAVSDSVADNLIIDTKNYIDSSDELQTHNVVNGKKFVIEHEFDGWVEKKEAEKKKQDSPNEKEPAKETKKDK